MEPSRKISVFTILQVFDSFSLIEATATHGEQESIRENKLWNPVSINPTATLDSACRTESGVMTPLLLVLTSLMALSFILVALMQESRMTASNENR